MIGEVFFYLASWIYSSKLLDAGHVRELALGRRRIDSVPTGYGTARRNASMYIDSARGDRTSDTWLQTLVKPSVASVIVRM